MADLDVFSVAYEAYMEAKAKAKAAEEGIKPMKPKGEKVVKTVKKTVKTTKATK
jgi:hypothetical protein